MSAYTKMNEWSHTPYTTEEQLAHLRQQIQAAETELIEREAELVDLRAEMYAFQLEYDTRVGRAAAELEAVEAELERCRKRISEYREWGPDSTSASNLALTPCTRPSLLSAFLLMMLSGKPGMPLPTISRPS